MRDVIFFRNRGDDAEGHAGRCRAPDGDVLRGSPARRRLRARDAGRRGGRARRRRGAAAQPRGASRPDGGAGRSAIRGGGWPIASTRRPSCWTRWRRSSGSSCASERRPDMLRTNLSTRPFYNERAVRVGIVVAVVLTAALTAFNAARDSVAEQPQQRAGRHAPRRPRRRRPSCAHQAQAIAARR